MMMNRQERLAIPKLEFHSKKRMESRRDILMGLLKPTPPPPSRWQLFWQRLSALKKGAWQTE